MRLASGPHLNIKTVFPGMGISMIKIRQSWYHLIFIILLYWLGSIFILRRLPGRVYTYALTHWGWVMHICVRKLSSIGSDNGLSPGQRQAIIWTNAAILLIRPLETNLSEILIKIHAFSFKKIHLKMSSGKYHPFCLCLNELNTLVMTWTI